MFDLKTNFKREYKSHGCLFCRAEPETLEHLFKGTDGLYCPQSLKDTALPNLKNINDTDNLKQTGFFSKNTKYRGVYERKLVFFCYGLRSQSF